MLTVNFILRNNPNALTLVFKAFKAADDVYKKSLSHSTEKLEFEDDFETKLSIEMQDVTAVTISDYAKDMDKNGDLQIVQQKAMLKTQSKAKSDVGLQMLTNQASNGFQQ